MKNRLALVAVMLVGIGIVAHRDAHAQAIPGPSGVPGGAILTGTIRSVDGNAMEGVAVSARTAGSRITTSVFTDAEGVYVFPPLANGNYRVWAQTVGYSTGHAEAPLNGSGVVRRDFSLGTASIGEITRQMSGADWFASLPESTIQERRIKQVVFHLLTNAINYSTEGSTVTLEVNREDDVVRFSVVDTGIGIAADDQEKIFDKFWRSAKAKTQHRSSGLGLALVKSFVELHGGWVEVASQPGAGTRVTCRLPVNAEDSQATGDTA